MTDQELFDALWQEAVREEHPELTTSIRLCGLGWADTIEMGVPLARKIVAAALEFDSSIDVVAERANIRIKKSVCSICGSSICDVVVLFSSVASS